MTNYFLLYLAGEEAEKRIINGQVKEQVEQNKETQERVRKASKSLSGQSEGAHLRAKKYVSGPPTPELRIRIEALMLSVFVRYGSMMRPEVFQLLTYKLLGSLRDHVAERDTINDCGTLKDLLDDLAGESPLSKARLILTLSPLPCLVFDPISLAHRIIPSSDVTVIPEFKCENLHSLLPTLTNKRTIMITNVDPKDVEDRAPTG
jgi:hypothetical protein